MNSPGQSDRPPSYNQVLNNSQEEISKYSAPYNSQVPITPSNHTIMLRFGSQPVIMICPYCGVSITTVIEEENGPIVYILCVLLFMTGFVFGCCLIPFCISDLKDKIHICPRCARAVGKKLFL